MTLPDKVLVPRASFEALLNGKHAVYFSSWAMFVEAFDAQVQEGELHLQLALTFVFVILVNLAIVIAIATFCDGVFEKKIADGHREESCLGLAFLWGALLTGVYALSFWWLCDLFHADSSKKLLSGVLYGAVPFLVGTACYLFAAAFCLRRGMRIWGLSEPSSAPHEPATLDVQDESLARTAVVLHVLHKLFEHDLSICKYCR